jgi:2-hydroxy-3-keto-5-methylthiopentenyl-1-phosphate phosphatase
MEPLIRAILSNLLGDDANDIEIISNSVDIHKDGSWNLKYRHPSRYLTRPFPQLAYPVLDLLSPQ